MCDRFTPGESDHHPQMLIPQISPTQRFHLRRFGAEVGIFGWCEGSGFENLGLGRKVAEFSLEIIPLRARAFYIFVNEVVIRHCLRFLWALVGMLMKEN